MRGLQHNVIEINDTENTDIEKILIFLKPGQHRISVDNTRRDAAEILKKVRVKRPRQHISPEIKILAAALGVITCVLAALIILV